VANFISGEGTVKQVPINGGTVITLVAGLSGSQNIAADATNVYYWSSFGTLSSVPISGGAANTVFSGMGATSPLALVVNSTGNYTDIYWTESSISITTVKRYNKASGNVTSLMSVPNNPQGVARNPQGIALDATSVYWMESDIYNTNITPNAWTGIGAIYNTLK
jgi:hypothetical protein